MARVSNWLITGLNVLTLLIALSAIGFSVFLHIKLESQCQRALKTPLLIVGIALLVVSLVGLVGSCCRVTALMWLYLFVLFVLILGLIGFTVFTIVVTNKSVGSALSGKGIENHKLGDYSKWLQRYVVNAENWDKIKSCLVEVKLCQRIKGAKHESSMIQSGCCKAPNNCGSHNSSGDCKRWSSDPAELCLECESCKAAVLGNIKRDWKLMTIINSSIVFLVILVYSVGCCALRNNRRSHREAP